MTTETMTNGSAKQIKLATDLKRMALKEMEYGVMRTFELNYERLLPVLTSEQIEQSEKTKVELKNTLEILKQRNDAQWWIATRGTMKRCYRALKAEGLVD